jgi:L-threonylcarbamoyladenylate synthase
MTIIPLKDAKPKEIVEALKEGQTIVYPTETCYGLGCEATNQASVDQIFSIKQRQTDKPLLVVMPSIEMARDYVIWTETIDTLATTYWPGPMTVVATAKPGTGLAKGVIADDGTVAFRITDYPVAVELSTALGVPLVSTSANISAQESPYDIASVHAMFQHATPQPDIIIDAGVLPHAAPSTIVKVIDTSIEILRQGERIVSL